MTMFATFVGFVGGVIFITGFINKLFKVENSRVKWIISWVMSIGIAIVGFVLQLGIFADCGTVDQWFAWVKVVLIGVGCAFAANKTYDANEIWTALEWLFSFFEKDGKEKRIAMAEEAKARRAARLK